MKPYPVIANEKERLRELHSYNILDTMNELEFNRITKIASEICNTPVSLMTLLDESRQWIKSSHGYALQETPREFAFCNHTVLDPHNVLEVSDLRKDIRFSENPLVTHAPHVVFYAGAPLITPSGNVLGSICVLDTQEKQLNDNQREALTALSQQVMNILELRKTIQALNSTQSALKKANHKLKNFAHVVSHDLKTPIANISMLTKILQNEHVKDSTDMGEIVSLISNSSESMLLFIDNVLISSTKTGNKKGIKAVMVQKVVEKVIEMIAPSSEVKINITNNLNSVKIDQSLLVQVFHNLISNAIKYNNKKSPEINICALMSMHNHSFVISDNGAGIPEGKLRTIFKKGTVCHDLDRYGKKGTGHGLFNIKSLLEDVGGKIEVTSTEHKGSTFTFHIPAVS